MRSDFEPRYLKEANEGLQKQLNDALANNRHFAHPNKPSLVKKMISLFKTNPFVLPDTLVHK